MNVDLHALVKLVHQVSGFLIRLTPEQLAGVADGRVSLSVGHLDTARRKEGPKEAPRQTAPADGSAVRAPALRQVPPRRSSLPGTVADHDIDHAEIAAQLRELGTTSDGYRFLDEQMQGRKRKKDDLLAIASELDIRELPKSITIAKLSERLVDKAIGAHKRYEGLRP